MTATEFEALRGDVNQLRRETFEQKKGYSELRRDLNDIKEKTESITVTEFETLKNHVNQLKRETLEQRKESSELRRELNDLREKTANVIKEDAFHAFRESQAEIYSRVIEISKDLQVLTGRFDENRYSMEKTLKDLATERNLIKTQIISIEGQIKDVRDRLGAIENLVRQPKEPPKEQPSFQPQQEVSQPPKPAEPKDKVAIYGTAYDAFKGKRYKEAREKFEAFIKEFPQDELADNAQFWIAETYYGEKDFEGAILAYETLLKKYPHSEKAPGALLKQGFSFIEIGDRKTGKTILEKLGERYPDSREAGLAKKKIEEIEKEARKKKK
ncbi:MAG: tol-pal system protein YbgF [Thermodesulfovibrionales bacterium]|nr:tol-pal system protein YbgF [Thermodesulfovibrionales bacterium]